MPRLHLFEFGDLPWFPQVIRTGMMDFLRHLITWLNFYGPIPPLIKETLEKSDKQQLLELCAGGGGGVMKLRENLKAAGCYPSIVLSDLYPNLFSYREIEDNTNGEIGFVSYPVNALDVPENLSGMRLLFSSFHHFKPGQAKEILADAMKKNVPIGIFDGGNKSIFDMISIIILQPIVFFVVTPFFRPFRWSRLFFTYLLPLIPLCTMWDGCVSVLRFYQVSELKQFADQINAKNYIWTAGQVKNSIGAKVNYLIGYPQKQTEAS